MTRRVAQAIVNYGQAAQRCQRAFQGLPFGQAIKMSDAALLVAHLESLNHAPRALPQTFY